LARRDRKGSLNDGRIQNPSNPFGIVPLSNFVPRGFGFVHHSIAILYHEVPNPNLTSRNFFIAEQYHGLEYPLFYDRLYSLLTASSFRARHRKRFFDLVETFLKSPLLPAYVAAAFIKRFARLALSAPPSGAPPIPVRTCLVRNRTTCGFGYGLPE
jgi:hypothetical protein